MRHWHGAAVSILTVLPLAGGCSSMKKPAPTAPSAFYRTCRDLDAPLRQAASAGGFTLGVTDSSGGGGGRGGGQTREHTEHRQAVECRTEDLDKVLPALKAEFRKLAETNGAVVTEASARETPVGSPRGFTLRYTTETAQGTVGATLGEGKLVPGKPGIQSYQLTIRVVETIPD